MIRVSAGSAEVKRTRKARPGSDDCPREIDQAPVASDPAPDEELAAVTGAPELAADVLARKPDVPLPDPAEERRRRRPDDPDILEQYEVIVVRGHGTILLRESAPSTRG